MIIECEISRVWTTHLIVKLLVKIGTFPFTIFICHRGGHENYFKSNNSYINLTLTLFSKAYVVYDPQLGSTFKIQ